jgi:hypothetical protein
MSFCENCSKSKPTLIEQCPHFKQKHYIIMSWHISLTVLCFTIFISCLLILSCTLTAFEFILQGINFIIWAIWHYQSCKKNRKYVITHTKTFQRENNEN